MLANIWVRLAGLVVLTMGGTALIGLVGLSLLTDALDGLDRLAGFHLVLTRGISMVEGIQAGQQHLFLETMEAEERGEAPEINRHMVLAQMARMQAGLDRALQVLAEEGPTTVAAGERQRLTRFGVGLADFRRKQAQLELEILRLLGDGEEDSAVLPDKSSRGVFHATVQQGNALHALLEELEELQEEIAETMRQRGVQQRRWLVDAWLATLLGMVGLTVWVALGFLRPVRQACDIARRVAAGDLDIQVQGVHSGQFGVLLISLASMVGVLRERREMEQLLRNSERLTTIGRLAIGLAHEINNPLANATVHLGLVYKHLDPAMAVVRERLSVVERNLAKAVALTRELLCFSQPGQPDPLPVNVYDAMESALRLLGAKLDGIRVHQSFEPDGEMYGYFGKLEQLFLNLFQNAVASMPNGGELFLAGRREHNGYAVVIRDTGPGMTPGQCRQAMEPFFTTHRDEGHFGLGLTICQNLVDQHGGTMVLSPSPTAGLMVQLWFPASPKAPLDRVQGQGHE